MCGIAGIISFRRNGIDFAAIERMTRCLRHRGPDDEGFAVFTPALDRVLAVGGEDTPAEVIRTDYPYAPSGRERPTLDPCAVALGHRRLSIIDLSPAGHQPMCTADRRFWIVYNGEIYNYIELREELQSEGIVFQSDSDTEVLLNAYRQWGEEALNRLIGMFAFALVDRKRKRLFLARDFFGIKPLYYTTWSGGFAFASEIKSILSLPHVRRRANRQRVYDYLRFGLTDHGEETMLEDLRQLPAGHFLILPLDREEQARPVRYWDIDLDHESSISFAEAAEQMREVFLESVRLHLRSDVPVGAALSGGIDSSSIVMAIRALMGDSVDLHTFSFIVEDESVSEEGWVDEVVGVSNVFVHKTKISSRDLLRDVARFVLTLDEPVGSTSTYALHRVFRLVPEFGVKVILEGQGADEILGGYLGSLSSRLASLLKNREYKNALTFFRHLNDNPLPNGMAFYALACLSKLLAPLADPWIQRPAHLLLPRWMSKSWFCGVNPASNRSFERASYPFLKHGLYKNLYFNSLPHLLRYGDRHSMAYSIENRVPFLTPRLVRFLFSLPETYLISCEALTKRVFREAMRGILPEVIRNRRDKMGAPTPEKSWLTANAHAVERLLTSERFRSIPALQHHSVLEEWNGLKEGRSRFDFRFWRWINLGVWSKLYNIDYDG